VSTHPKEWSDSTKWLSLVPLEFDPLGARTVPPSIAIALAKKFADSLNVPDSADRYHAQLDRVELALAEVKRTARVRQELWGSLPSVAACRNDPDAAKASNFWFKYFTATTPAQMKAALDDFNSKISKADECPICMEDINGDRVTTGCNHKFHGACLRNALAHNDQCPTCRARKPVATGG